MTVNGDALDENSETFNLDLSGASAATIADSRGVATIVDDDPTPTLSINDVSITEGNSGTKNVTFTVSLSAVEWPDSHGRISPPQVVRQWHISTIRPEAATLTFNPGSRVANVYSPDCR